ncbi:hypothetical protein BMETH_1239_0 [methanotrophic bacterial endosymbiont of Bathymodiolus sp.]|nr:hypothetical protein BMETH_1239_0 [methanotrophic bacterial endosymbiont of Bathymodiolus sp.]
MYWEWCYSLYSCIAASTIGRPGNRRKLQAVRFMQLNTFY